MTSAAYQRGRESDELAALSRRLREQANQQQNAATNVTPSAARAPTVQAAPIDSPTVVAAPPLPLPSKQGKEKKAKRKHAAAPGAAAAPEVAPAGGPLASMLDDLRATGAALRQAAMQEPFSAEPCTAQLAALTACVSQLCDAVAAAGGKPAQSPALALLQMQLTSIGGVPALPPPPQLLIGLSLQAEAAALATEQLQAAGTDQQQLLTLGQQQERFSRRYMSAFADCYSDEVEALQTAEPPIPAGVLLHWARKALKRELSNPQLQGLMTAKQQRTGVTVLAASSNGNGNGSGTAEPMALDAAVTTGDAGPSGAGVDVEAVAAKHGWDLQARNDWQGDRQVRWLPLASIRRPLARSRSNDPEKVAALMQSIQDIGLQEPIDVLEVDGKFWGFSGCHRFEAHQRLGKEQILCRVRKATPAVLKFHMM
ncbi:hypothetical protein D9Q98_001207 [Chlorella vulgaris]|uniref:sulfiredoxin n=1 Tax=Chlorella vulgaris TaxID=3077 RepID=A0A9D4Z2E4_CHLVU|nr:hypothetical protein D9Q98_001207 [Chlorella vulgaris]